MIKFFEHSLVIPNVASLIDLEYKTYIPNSELNSNQILQQNPMRLIFKDFVQQICDIVNVQSYRYIVSKCLSDIDWHIDSSISAINMNLIVEGYWNLLIGDSTIKMDKSQLYVLDTSIKHRVVGDGLFLFLSITPYSMDYRYDF